jgi:anion-transporting  ArsA/GET3 family ATPase
LAKATNQRLIFVTGKGGVGKSSIAAAIAIQAVKSGKKVLLAELGIATYFGILFGKNGQAEPQATPFGFDWCSWQADQCLREYVQHLVKLERLTKIFFDNKIMRTFVGAAPALQELAILGKITSGIRGVGKPIPYDWIVVDAHSTGHFLSLLRAPMGMAELFVAGPMGEQSRAIVDTFRNPQFSKFIHVTLPEELPVLEAIELQADLRSTVNQNPNLICNMALNPKLLNQVKSWQNLNGTANDKLFLSSLEQRLTRQARAVELLQGSMSNSSQIGSKSFQTVPMVFAPDATSTIKQLGEIFPESSSDMMRDFL